MITNREKTTIIILFAIFLSILFQSTAIAYTTGLESNSRFIAAKGTIPDNIDQEWNSSLTDCWFHLTKNKPYSQFDISIVSYVGTGGNYIRVDLDPYYQEQLNETKIDEIYRNIENYCENTVGLSEVPLVFMWDEETSSLPELGQSGFEEAEKRPGFIEARGTIPEITEDGKKREWYGQLSASAPAQKVNEYATENNVALASFGYDGRGYLWVGFINEVDESTIDEIYDLIETHYEQVGIYDVPVVFTVSGEFIEEVGDPSYPIMLVIAFIVFLRDEIVPILPGIIIIMLLVGTFVILRRRKNR